MGPVGTGKTAAIVTLLAAGIETFVAVTEPNGVDILVKRCKELSLDLSKLHWCVVSPVVIGTAALRDMAKAVRTSSFEQLSNMKQGVGKEHQLQFESLLDCVDNFHDHRTGKSFGSPLQWDASRAFVLDSLSGLNAMCMDITVGYKPTAAMGEWGVAMKLEVKLLQTLASQLPCYFVLTAHLDREVDEVTGITSITASALGRKNAPEILKMFSDIVLCRRDGQRFFWSTQEANTTVKHRFLPIAPDIKPDYRIFVDAYSALEKTVGAVAPISDETTL